MTRHAILFTNLHTVWVGPLRTHCAALVLESDERRCQLRGFGYDSAWSVFDLDVPLIEYTIEVAESESMQVLSYDDTMKPLFRGGYLHIKGLQGAPTPIQFDLDDHERALDIEAFEDPDLYTKLWATLEHKVVDYYTRPAIPVLSHVPTRRELRKMYKL